MAKNDFNISKELQTALKLFPKIVKEHERRAKEKKKIQKKFEKLSKQLEKREAAKNKVVPDEVTIKIHPWRLCPIGKHWVKSHPMRTPGGGVTTRDGHCRTSARGLDILTLDEIENIASHEFSKLKKSVCSAPLEFIASGDDFDSLIQGWTQYWNDIFVSVAPPLDPNLVKALIASESSFKAGIVHRKTKAVGLMQIMPMTQKILTGEIKELKNHFVSVSLSELISPNANIAAGIRWLFQKRYLMKNVKSWEEVVIKYKGYKGFQDNGMKRFLKLYNEILNNCKDEK